MADGTDRDDAPREGGPSDAGKSAPDAVPGWVTWNEKAMACDLDGTGTAETLDLGARRLTITDEAAGVTYESPEDWQVSDVLVADLNLDGKPEVISLVWKRGSYGSVRPFWVTEDDDTLSQHLFIHQWVDGGLKPLWMSSKMPVEAVAVELTALTAGSGTDDLQGAGSSIDRPALRILDTKNRQTTWAWLSWGLKLVDGPTPASGMHADRDGADDEPVTLTLLVAGDNIAHANVYESAYDRESRAFDFSPIYEHVRDFVGGHDVAAVVQETPLVANPARRRSYPLFATPQSMGDALTEAGFDVILAATNHACDAGLTGLRDTCAFWAERHPEVTLLGLRRTSSGVPASIDCIEKDGIRLALFDYTYGLNGQVLPAGSGFQVDVLDEAGTTRLLADVKAAAGQSDAVICFLHIGEEYQTAPTDEQRCLVERLVDAGADAVICSHTHVLGPHEALRTAAGNEGVVFWGLGNFMTGQWDRAETVLGGMARLTIEKQTSTASATCAGGAARTDDSKKARIASFEMTPVVCHTDIDGSVAVYLLDDYTEELAERHVINRECPGTLTLVRLRELAGR